ncbi:MAG: hypothetical protein IJ805_02895, partial [Lachnospiraceae bacterium]|nr:hypothetical protein [Lachnospiraceae bacterium]
MELRLENIEENELAERYELSKERINDIRQEHIIAEPYGAYFRECARILTEGSYEDMLPSKYNTCYANPVYSVKLFGKEMGRLLSFLAYEIFNVIPFYAEKAAEDVVITNEVFLEVYSEFIAQEQEGGKNS